MKVEQAAARDVSPDELKHACFMARYHAAAAWIGITGLALGIEAILLQSRHEHEKVPSVDSIAHVVNPPPNQSWADAHKRSVFYQPRSELVIEGNLMPVQDRTDRGAAYRERGRAAAGGGEYEIGHYRLYEHSTFAPRKEYTPHDLSPLAGPSIKIVSFRGRLENELGIQANEDFPVRVRISGELIGIPDTLAATYPYQQGGGGTFELLTTPQAVKRIE